MGAGISLFARRQGRVRVRRWLPDSLFGRTLLTLSLSFGFLALILTAALVHFALGPVAKRSAEDLAAFMVLSAQTWLLLPADLREHYQRKLRDEHQLWIEQARSEALAKQRPVVRPPYIEWIEKALAAKLGMEIPVRNEIIDGRRWYSVELRLSGADDPLRLRFASDRIRVRPWVVLGLLGIAGILVASLTAVVLARRITLPLTRLTEAAHRLGEGEFTVLPESSGPLEMRVLAAEFNRMAGQVRELLANRTTLLAGVSHDLRTPLARIRLAVEMLDPVGNPSMLERIRRDLERMNHLIGDALELANDLHPVQRDRVDLADFLDGIVADYRQAGAALIWHESPSCPRLVNLTALRRVLVNLIDNALRYGGPGPAEIELLCWGRNVEIRVLDRGAGIPESQREEVFQPFFRLDHSRSSETGGSGLGLAIARQLAEANGWSLSLSGRAGGGAAAIVRLPQAAA